MAILKRHSGTLRVWQLEADDTARIARLDAMFVQLMPSYAYYVPRLHANIATPIAADGTQYHVWLAEIDAEPAGLTVFEYIPQQGVGLGMDLAVYPDYRDDVFEGYTLPHYLIRARLQQLSADATKLGHNPAVPLAVEVESARLLAQFVRYGLHVLDVPYYEPPDVSGQSDPQGYAADDATTSAAQRAELEALGYHPMHLGFYPPLQAIHFDVHDRALHQRILRAFYWHHYHLSADNRAYLLAASHLSSDATQQQKDSRS